MPRLLVLASLASLAIAPLAGCTKNDTLDLAQPGQTPVPAVWFDDAWSHRRELVVGSSGAGAAAGYSLSIVLDHRALVDAGRALAGGDDIRIVREEASTTDELDVVLDSGDTWNEPSTRIWFRAPDALPLAAGIRYHLYYDNSAAGTPPSDASAVFAFADDFESGNLSKWTQVTGAAAFTSDTAQAHGGLRSMRGPGATQTSEEMQPAGMPPLAGVSIDGWSRVGGTDVDVAFSVRSSTTRDNYMANGSFSGAWTLAKLLNDNYTAIGAADTRGAVSGTWYRFTLQMVGTQARLLAGGTPFVPASGWQEMGSEIASGSVGVEVFDLGIGETWHVDDITVRPLVFPDPILALGTEEARP